MSVANSSFADIAAVLDAQHSFVIVSHLRPDGDALGSAVAMALALKELGKDVTVWNEDLVPEKLTFLPHSDLIERPDPAVVRDFDVAILLDTAVKKRAGTPLQSIGAVKTWINIDHHITNDGYGDLNYIDPVAPATGQILFEMLRATDLPLTYAVADNLFAAISTDTGSFQYPNTTARTYEIAAELIKAGVDVGHLSQELYESYPLRRIELLRLLLNSMKLTCDGRVASFSLSLKDVAKIGSKPEDTEGLIDHIRAIKGVIVAVFIEQLAEDTVRLSMRSKDRSVDVSAICARFGGGGHPLAAGARVQGSLTEVRQRALNTIGDVVQTAATSTRHKE